ncbi:MAG: FkbM family methyltransferase, partial [Bacteroidota bacterium]
VAWMYLPNGFKLYLSPKDQYGPSYHVLNEGKNAFEEYEKSSKEALDAHLPSKGGVLLDIGANVGLYSFYFLQKKVDLSVYAFEPNPIGMTCMQNTIKANNLSSIDLIAKGLSNQKDNSKLYLSNLNQGNHSLRADMIDVNKGVKTVDIETLRLDDWMAEVKPEKVDALKIDVEGWEFQVLDGARKFLRKYRPSLLIECRKSLLLESQSVLSVLEEIPEANYYIRESGVDKSFPMNEARKYIKETLDLGKDFADYLFFEPQDK